MVFQNVIIKYNRLNYLWLRKKKINQEKEKKLNKNNKNKTIIKSTIT